MHVQTYSFPFDNWPRKLNVGQINTCPCPSFSILHLKLLPPTSAVHFSPSLSHIHTLEYSLTLCCVANAGWMLSWEHIFDSFLGSLAAKTHKLTKEAEEVQALEGEKRQRLSDRATRVIRCHQGRTDESTEVPQLGGYLYIYFGLFTNDHGQRPPDHDHLKQGFVISQQQQPRLNMLLESAAG